jgi:hypothetical protein
MVEKKVEKTVASSAYRKVHKMAVEKVASTAAVMAEKKVFLRVVVKADY